VMTSHAIQCFLDGAIVRPGTGSRVRPPPRQWRRASFGPSSNVIQQDAAEQDPAGEWAAAYCTCAPISQSPCQSPRSSSPTGPVVQDREQAESPTEQALLHYRSVLRTGGGGFKLPGGSKLRAPSLENVASNSHHQFGDRDLDYVMPASPLSPQPALSTPRSTAEPSPRRSPSKRKPPGSMRHTPSDPPVTRSQSSNQVLAIVATPTTCETPCSPQPSLQVGPTSTLLSKASFEDGTPERDFHDVGIGCSGAEAGTSDDLVERDEAFQQDFVSVGLQTVSIHSALQGGGGSRPPGTKVRVQRIVENSIPFEQRRWVRLSLNPPMEEGRLRKLRYEKQLGQMFPALPQVSSPARQSPLTLLRRNCDSSSKVWR